MLSQWGGDVMRSLAIDSRINAVRCSWEGSVNNSVSRMEVSGSVVRRNLFTTPIANSLGIWSNPKIGTTGVNPTKSLVESFLRLTIPVSGTTFAVGDLTFSSVGHIKPIPGRDYVSTLCVRSSAPLVVRAQQVFILSGSGVSNKYGPTVTLSPHTWASLSVISTNVVLADYMRLDLDSAAPVTFPEGTTIDIALASTEEGTIVKPLFSGDTKGEELLSLSLDL